MGKSRAELNAAADERARAAGFTNRSQQYRAKKDGYAGKGNEYNVVLDRRRSSGLVKRAARGKLLGGAATQSGTVISADLWNGEGAQLWRELQRFRGDRQCRVVIEMGDGSIVNVGNKGGMRLDYLRKLRGQLGNTPDETPLDDRPRSGAHIVTVTVV